MMISQIWTQLSHFKRYLNRAIPNLRGARFLKRWHPLAQAASQPFIPGWLHPRPAASAVAVRQTSKLIRQKKFYRALCALAFLAVIGAAPVIQAESLRQAGGPTLQITGPALVTVGETFEIRVTLNQPLPPGIFGYQFRLNWDSAAVAPLDASPILSPDFPLIAQTQIADGQLLVAASRQGDVPDLTGSLTLLAWTFQATTAGISPTPFDLTAVTLGQKDGTALPVAGIINLAVQVVEPAQPRGKLVGNIQVEGPAPGNLAGITLLINERGLATITTTNGDFAFTDLDFGVYTLTARRPGFLSATCTGISHNSETTTLAGVTLLAGDITGDDAIDVTDATALGLAIGGNGLGAAADLNMDGQVDVLDLILLAVNFGQSAAAQPWLCQP